MAARFIDVSIAMDSQIELLAFKHKAFIHRGQKQMHPASESVHRDGQKAVVATGVASDYGSIAVSSRLVGAYDLPFQ